jgi:P27 family predicted phage terminase small subunit
MYVDDRVDPELPAAPPPDPPPPPTCLDAVAAEKWRQIFGEIKADSFGDRDLLEVYCTTWARWKEAEALVAELGTVIKSPSGYPCQSPYLSIANRAAADLLKIGRQLGLPY